MVGEQAGFPMSLTSEPWTCWPRRRRRRLAGGSRADMKAGLAVIYCAAFANPPISFLCIALPMFYNLNFSLTATLFCFIFFPVSPQTFEQKQTPVPPRAPLPVQPQTGTTVSTSLLFPHPPLLLHPFPVPISSSFDVLRDLRESTAAVFFCCFYLGWRFKSRQVTQYHSLVAVERLDSVSGCVHVCICVCERECVHFLKEVKGCLEWMFCLDLWGIFIREYKVFPESLECESRSWWCGEGLSLTRPPSFHSADSPIGTAPLSQLFSLHSGLCLSLPLRVLLDGSNTFLTLHLQSFFPLFFILLGHKVECWPMSFFLF